MGAGAAVASNVVSSIRTALIQSLSHGEEGSVSGTIVYGRLFQKQFEPCLELLVSLRNGKR